jgi:hypothetical protein
MPHVCPEAVRMIRPGPGGDLKIDPFEVSNLPRNPENRLRSSPNGAVQGSPGQRHGT